MAQWKDLLCRCDTAGVFLLRGSSDQKKTGAAWPIPLPAGEYTEYPLQVANSRPANLALQSGLARAALVLTGARIDPNHFSHTDE